MLKIYYSSGKADNFEFQKQPSKSIGGLISDVLVSEGGNKLFGTVAASDLANGSEDFRCIFLKNESPTQEIAELAVYSDVLEDNLGEGFDPSTLTPSQGDKYIVPTGAIGAWSGYDGKIATWNNSAWEFSFNYFFVFEFSKEIPEDVVINNLTYEQVLVQIINDIYETPYGIDFVSADREPNKLSLGRVNSGKQIALWIKKAVGKYVFEKIDFDVAGVGYVEAIELNQDIDLKFEYKLLTSYKITGDSEFSGVISTPKVINMTMETNVGGDEGYSNLRCNVTIKRNGVAISSDVVMSVDFMSIVYPNVQDSGYFGLIGGFVAGITFSELIEMTITCAINGIWEFIIDIVDINNDENILHTKTFTLTIP